MARLALWILVGTICASLPLIGQAQQGGGPAKASSAQLPAQVCQAVEQYIAKIDAARSLKEKTRREEKYREALDGLSAVLKPRGETALLAQAEEYARYCEMVVTADSANPKLDEMVDKRLKTRSEILKRCEEYTSTR